MNKWTTGIYALARLIATIIHIAINYHILKDIVYSNEPTWFVFSAMAFYLFTFFWIVDMIVHWGEQQKQKEWEEKEKKWEQQRQREEQPPLN